RKPLIVRRYDIPGRIRSGGVLDHVFGSVHGIFPEAALSSVRRRKFPALLRGSASIQKASLLLFFVNDEGKLSDNHAIAAQVALETLDVLEALIPDAFADQAWRQLLFLQ